MNEESLPLRLLLLCRPGFEKEAAEEGVAALDTLGQGARADFAADQGFVWVVPTGDAGSAWLGLDGLLHWKQFIFVRQWWIALDSVPLGQEDRVAVLCAQGRRLPHTRFGAVVMEWPDTNSGKEYDGLSHRLQGLVETALHDSGLLVRGQYRAQVYPTLRFFFHGPGNVTAGWSLPGRAAPWNGGIVRQRMPAQAPSRSTLKLAEAFEVFLGDQGRDAVLRPGMHAVDLGAAPGGWTWQFASRGIHVDAVDNGPLKGEVARHPLVRHLRADGFRYRPRKTVDWMVCDMVEQPARVAELVSQWAVHGWARNFLFNLKLPMRSRKAEVDACLEDLTAVLQEAGIRHRMQARQLYHDREEVTVYLRRDGKGKPRSASW